MRGERQQLRGLCRYTLTRLRKRARNRTYERKQEEDGLASHGAAKARAASGIGGVHERHKLAACACVYGPAAQRLRRVVAGS